MSAFDKILKNSTKDSKIYVSKSLDVAEQIKEHLLNKNMSQSDLAKVLGKHESEISKWLSGLHNFSIRTIAKIEAIIDEDILVTPKRYNNKFYKKVYRFNKESFLNKDRRRAIRNIELAYYNSNDHITVAKQLDIHAYKKTSLLNKPAEKESYAY